MQVVPVPTPKVPKPLTDLERMQVEVENIKKNLHLIESGQSGSDVCDNVLTSVGVIGEIVQFVTNADDFHRIGGFELLPKLLTFERADIRAATAELVADLVQNNGYCQTKLLETEAAKVLMLLLKTDEDSNVCIKALYALSCLCRNNKEVVHLLKELDALPVLVEVIKKPVEKLRTKAAFFLSSVVKEREVQDSLYSMGFVKQLIELLKEEVNPSHEHLLSTLATMIEGHKNTKDDWQKDNELKALLQEKVCFYKDKEEYQESLDYVNQLLKQCC